MQNGMKLKNQEVNLTNTICFALGMGLLSICFIPGTCQQKLEEHGLLPVALFAGFACVIVPFAGLCIDTFGKKGD